ncbi:unnamed protein product [Caenorhabditis sp. 36 PRJEB53466]|nr:unnamed protein product [Caenorhabditis sp. 36 PRJEB53466]
MFVNWAHYYIPKCAIVLSYVFNPTFIYLVMSDRKSQMGNYRYLLITFAFFNMACSLCDVFVPMCVHDHRYMFMVYISDGPFVSKSFAGQWAIAIRCGFISCTYGILNVHFVFRYLVLKRGELLRRYFLPYGLILSILFCVFHLLLWAVICQIYLFPVTEKRVYIEQSLRDLYDGDSMDLNFLAALYGDTTNEIRRDSWTGILLITAISTYSVCLYFIVGYKIVTGLNENVQMSRRTNEMQRQLFKALTVQTVIPICVSFAPCVASFYGAAFLIPFPNFIYWMSPVAVALFPFLDPLAIIFFLPSLRRRLNFHVKISVYARSSSSSDPSNTRSSRPGANF